MGQRGSDSISASRRFPRCCGRSYTQPPSQHQAGYWAVALLKGGGAGDCARMGVLLRPPLPLPVSPPCAATRNSEAAPAPRLGCSDHPAYPRSSLSYIFNALSRAYRAQSGVRPCCSPVAKEHQLSKSSRSPSRAQASWARTGYARRCHDATEETSSQPWWWLVVGKSKSKGSKKGGR